jgi:peptide/nickel transport system permease protein
MGQYILRRILQGIPVLFLITLIVFIVVYLIPGDPAIVILGHDATPQALAAVRKSLGLNNSLPERYLIWLRHVMTGDLGRSILSQQPVLQMIRYAFPVTAYLTFLSLLVAIVIAVPCGVIAALKRNTWVDLLFTAWAFFGISVPSFWLGIMLIYLFSARLRWAPLQGYISPFDDFVGSLKTMVLPAFTLGIFLSGPLMRYLRSSVLQVMDQDYVTVARAKGLAERRIILGHIVRNSLIPFVTVLGIQLGYLLGGAVIIEEVFALPGIGRLAVDAIGNRDFPVVQGIVLLVALGFVVINIIVDVVYALLDPRIRVGKGAA